VIDPEPETNLSAMKTDVTSLFNPVRSFSLSGKHTNLRVTRKGNWYIFEGVVKSDHVKTRLFSSVPKIDGAQWIVDRLHVNNAA
jgi:hypothetical protein